MQERSDWKIRQGHAGDVDEVVELLRTCLGAGSVPRSVDFWRWKHGSNPFGASPVLLATAGGRIVGVRAFLRWGWHWPGGEVQAVRAVDTATHPDWRGCGIFSRLTRQLAAQVAEENVAFIFNTPNRKSGSGYRKMGWRTVTRLPLYVRLLRPGALLRVSGGGRSASADASRLQPVADFLDHPETAGFLDHVEASRRNDPRLRTAATLPYLRWRYAAPPDMDYRAIWEGSGEAAAALVLRPRRRRGLLELSLSEILTGAAAGVDTAVRLLRRLGTSSGADYAIAIASPGTPEHATLRRAGFLRIPAAGPRLVARSLVHEPQAPDPLDPDSWRFTAGSFELF